MFPAPSPKECSKQGKIFNIQLYECITEIIKNLYQSVFTNFIAFFFNGQQNTLTLNEKKILAEW